MVWCWRPSSDGTQAAIVLKGDEHLRSVSKASNVFSYGIIL